VLRTKVLGRRKAWAKIALRNNVLDKNDDQVGRISQKRFPPRKFLVLAKVS